MTTDAAPPLSPAQQSWRLLAASAIGLFLWFTNGVVASRAGYVPDWFVVGDPLVGAGCLAVVLWRRRFPVAVTLATAAGTAASVVAAGPAMLALCSLATRRRPLEIAGMMVAMVGLSQIYVEHGLGAPVDGPLWVELGTGTLTTGIVAAVGAAIGARRVEVQSLRQRAEIAEREQHARAGHARVQERNRIAREMHDVLAHRISLVSMQAGVLDHRRDLPDEERHVLVRSIAESSHQALDELRQVLGVLRAESETREPPQPSFEDVPNLVDEARSAGLDVEIEAPVSSAPSKTVGRTCYRIVQEGLTNATKHAPGAAVRVRIEPIDDQQLRICIHNTSATGPAPTPPSSGFGLLGLAERVNLAGGTLDHRPTSDGGYVLTACLPWTCPESDEGS